MNSPGFLPALQPQDVEQAAQLIQQAYSPTAHLSSEQQRRLQAELFEIQKKPEAWGLVIPFSQHSDQNVQFFGAHTIQVKITRDWESFPHENAPQLRDLLLELTAHSIVIGRNRVVLRKLFVAITALAIKLSPTRSSIWPSWILSTINLFSSKGVSTEHILDFLSIVAEEADTAELLSIYKASMRESISEASPVVVQAVTTSVTQRSNQLQPALKCLEAWMPHLPSNELTPIVPLLISLLNPADESTFVLASDALQELMTHPPFADGSAFKVLTEPLLLWIDKWARNIVQSTLTNGFVDPISNSLCKLLVAFGEQSVSYFAANIASSTPLDNIQITKSHLVQSFLSILLSYTGLPGYAGADETESEMTLSFWYIFQEALWSVDYHPEFFDEGEEPVVALEGDQANIINALYQELVQILRRKVAWPPAGHVSWSKDEIDKFQIYRRDVGDTLINAYYILRKGLTEYYINDITQRLQSRNEHDGWEEIEATLHCFMAIQEAVPVEPNPDLSRLFSPEILGRIPTVGPDRVRRTTLVLIGSYASWFTTQPTTPPSSAVPSALMSAISYVVSGLSDPALCLPAANALRSLCDSNRLALAPHISAFGELHAGLTGIPDTERSKVLQSIASVIQALPPEEEIPPVETIVNPIISRLYEALQLSNQLPEDARLIAIHQLQALTGVAKGLTRVSDSLLTIDETPEAKLEAERLRAARNDSRMVKLREALLGAIKLAIEMWSTDASVGDALSDIIKAMTSLPSDMTLLSLPAGPLLELVNIAAQRQLTAVWLSLTSMLIIQLDPPTFLPPTIKVAPNTEAQILVGHTLPVLLRTSLTFLAQPGAMEENPDIVQGFFSCMESFSQHFISMFHQLPHETFDALIHCSIAALGLQERYSMVAGCSFIASIILKTFSDDKLTDAKNTLIQRYGRRIMHGILCGLAGVSPRSVIPNLVNLMLSLLTRCPAESRAWARDVLYADDFVASRAGPEAKEKFLTLINSSGKSPKRVKDAANQFALVARGMEAAGFGYGASTM